jgi:hypothetical protein
MLKPVSTSFMCSRPVILLLNLSAVYRGENLFGTYRYRQISSFLAYKKTQQIVVCAPCGSAQFRMITWLVRHTINPNS